MKEFDPNRKENKKLVNKFYTLLQHQGEQNYYKGFLNICSSILKTCDYIKLKSENKKFVFSHDSSNNNELNNCYIFKVKDISEVTKFFESQGYRWGGTLLKQNDGIVTIELFEKDRNFGKCYKFI